MYNIQIIVAEPIEEIETNYGIDFLNNYNIESYDLIIMDVQMPIMDGYIATQMIRNMKREDVANVPVIAMTTLSAGEGEEEALRAGMNGFITKPLQIGELKEILMKWM